MELDVSTEIDGVTLRGHAEYVNGGTLSVRMFEPYSRNIAIRSTFFSRVPTTEEGVRRRAEMALKRSYSQKRIHDAERDAKTTEEWGQAADAAHRRIRALNVRMHLLHEVMMGTAKSDLKKGLLSQKEYMQLLHAFRDRAADARQELERLQYEQTRARRYVLELRAIASGDA